MRNNYSLTVLLPVINETYSLEKTVNILLKNNPKEIEEIIIIISKDKTQINSIKVIDSLIMIYPKIIKKIYQDLPYLGGAIQNGFNLAKGTHVVMMASDLETDPEDVKEFVKISSENKDYIITATRWKSGDNFYQYNYIKLILNFIFQNMLKLLFNTKLTDLTYGYRLFPSHIIKKIEWEELKHPFLLETILKPLKLNITIVEIPSIWKARSEGTSQNDFITNFFYLTTAIKIKFLWKQ